MLPLYQYGLCTSTDTAGSILPVSLLVFCWLLLVFAVAHVPDVSVLDGGDLPGQDFGIWHPEGPIQLLNWPPQKTKYKPAEGRASTRCYWNKFQSDVPSSPFCISVFCFLLSPSIIHCSLHFSCIFSSLNVSWTSVTFDLIGCLPLSASFIITFTFFRLNFCFWARSASLDASCDYKTFCIVIGSWSD